MSGAIPPRPDMDPQHVYGQLYTKYQKRMNTPQYEGGRKSVTTAATARSVSSGNLGSIAGQGQ